MVASYVFYALADIRYLPYIVVTTACVFFTALLIGNVNAKAKQFVAQNDLDAVSKQRFRKATVAKKRWIMIAGVLISLGILAFVKYYDFVAVNVNLLLSTEESLPVLDIILPLGISFYTFQAVGYLIDVYRGKVAPDRNIAKFALFVSFFPQLVQGPISRYDQLAHQLYEPHSFSFGRLKNGGLLILWGFFKKLVVADRAGILVNNVIGSYASFAGSEILFAILMYGLQIYMDFSGGIDIARGVAQVLGIDMAQNFNHPYFARTLSDYWRRWHMTLGSWMRDYLFYPLALSKAFTRLGAAAKKVFGTYIGKVLPTAIITLITFAVVGIWHGADWKYVAYGLYYGGLIALSLLLEPLFNKMAKGLRINTESTGWWVVQALRTLAFVTVGRYFTRAVSLPDALSMLKRTFTDFDWSQLAQNIMALGLGKVDYFLLILSVVLLFVIGVTQEKGTSIRQSLQKRNIVFRWTAYFGLIFSILLFAVDSQYIVGSFIYAQF